MTTRPSPKTTKLGWAVIGRYGLSLDVIGCHWTLWAVIGRYGLSLDVMGCHWTLWAVIGRYGLSLDVMGCHWMLWAVIGRYRLSLDVMGCHLTLWAGHLTLLQGPDITSRPRERRTWEEEQKKKKEPLGWRDSGNFLENCFGDVSTETQQWQTWETKLHQILSTSNEFRGVNVSDCNTLAWPSITVSF
ncbi:hypothetical protein Bpfe_010413 [Biomphalaria pfeifferi]|uniref:Uncharacterized protein n=1 Tax=Biomphalaria pfeifferi TaxID=112525 RepID=A0AAD8BTA3_BIOPF|nr:hypothetical protein Bpfe_010413 [Biomphalaria pfeifferi]